MKNIFIIFLAKWETEPDEIRVSYDVTNFYPSIPINKVIDVILHPLSEDYEDLKARTKLTLIDIQQLIELCLKSVIFFGTMSFGIYLTQDLLVFQQWLLYEKVSVVLKRFRRYVGDSHARFGRRINANEFSNLLNSQERQMQYTLEYEITIRN